MIIKNGKTISSIYKGSQEIEKIYKGTKLVFKNSLLPSEYQQVEYIESTGTQYIDTELVFNDIKNTDVGISFEANDFTNAGPTTGRIFGGSTGDSDYIGARYGTTGSSTLVVYKRTKDSSPTSITIDNVTNAELEFIGNEVILNGALQGTFNNLIKNTSSQRTCVLFGYNTTSLQIIQIPLKIKCFWVKVGGILTRNMMPCYRKSDGEIGMYDLVNNIFYTNAGSGIFLKGEDI